MCIFTILFGIVINRFQNSSIIQLYEILHDKINMKSKFIEETRKGVLLSRFIKPFFSSDGTYAYIIRFYPLNIDKTTQKAFPFVARINFNQSVRRIFNDKNINNLFL
jgi:hypothetical protein